MGSKTAILIFANSAEKEAVYKPFHFSKDVFKAFNAQTLQLVKKTELPYFVFSEKKQIGLSFGERFTNAIQSVYNKGFDAVITIGNDTPHLSLKHLTKTINKLQKHNIVLGPSKDGGFYLMGLKKSQFNANAFLKLPWQTSTLNKSIAKLSTSKKVDICYLEVLSDLDSASDITTIVNSFKSLSIVVKKLFIQCLFINKKIILTFTSFIESIIVKRQLNKGSPIFPS